MGFKKSHFELIIDQESGLLKKIDDDTQSRKYQNSQLFSSLNSLVKNKACHSINIYT